MIGCFGHVQWVRSTEIGVSETMVCIIAFLLLPVREELVGACGNDRPCSGDAFGNDCFLVVVSFQGKTPKRYINVDSECFARFGQFVS